MLIAPATIDVLSCHCQIVRPIVTASVISVSQGTSWWRTRREEQQAEHQDDDRPGQQRLDRPERGEVDVRPLQRAGARTGGSC